LKKEDAMEEQKTIGRREFSVATALAMLSGVAIVISETACGGDSPTMPSPTPTPGATPTPAPATDKTGTISANHGHVAVISGATLTAGGAFNLDISGSAGHPHTVELSAAEITSIAGGQRVSKESSTDMAHSHTVTFN
jgi:hypothetical protein